MTWNWLFYKVVSLVCILAAVFLAYHGRDGWGWFLLFVGALTAIFPSYP